MSRQVFRSIEIIMHLHKESIAHGKVRNMTFEEERIEKMEKALMDINKESRVLYGIKEKIIAMMDAANDMNSVRSMIAAINALAVSALIDLKAVDRIAEEVDAGLTMPEAEEGEQGNGKGDEVRIGDTVAIIKERKDKR